MSYIHILRFPQNTSQQVLKSFTEQIQEGNNAFFHFFIIFQTLRIEFIFQIVRMMDDFREKYKSLDKIGEGTYGWVEKAENQKGQLVAIKHIKLNGKLEGIPKSAIREMSILKNLSDHPNLAKLRQVDYKYKERSLKFVFDYYQYDLKLILQFRKEELTQKEKKIMLKQILQALNCCHTANIIHRDLKPENILVDKELNVKVADFGLSRLYHQRIELTPKVQSLYYRSPEILLGNPNYDWSADIWSVGCIFAQLYTGKPLFEGKNEVDQISSILKIIGSPSEQQWNLSKLPIFNPDFLKFKKQSFKEILPKMNQQAINLLESMLQMNPEKRIKASQALQHDFFKNLPKQYSFSTDASDQADI